MDAIEVISDRAHSPLRQAPLTVFEPVLRPERPTAETAHEHLDEIINACSVGWTSPAVFTYKIVLRLLYGDRNTGGRRPPYRNWSVRCRPRCRLPLCRGLRRVTLANRRLPTRLGGRAARLVRDKKDRRDRHGGDEADRADVASELGGVRAIEVFPIGPPACSSPPRTRTSPCPHRKSFKYLVAVLQD